MAFEPRTSIAQIMQNASANYQSPLSQLSAGYARGVGIKTAKDQNRRANEELDLAKKKMTQEEAARVVEEIGGYVSGIAVLPPEQRPAAWDNFRRTSSTKYGKDPGPYSEQNLQDILLESQEGLKTFKETQKFGEPKTYVDASNQPQGVQFNPYGQSRTSQVRPEPKKALVNFEPGALGGAVYNETEYMKEWSKKQAAGDATFEQTLYDGVKQASENDYRLNRMEALLNEGTSVGAASPVTYAISKWAAALGANVDPSNQEEFARISNQLAFDELAKFKGPTSEKELAFAMGLVGNLAGEKAATLRYILVGKRMNQRTRDAQEFYNKRLQETGSAKGIRREMAQWMVENPLIGTPATQQDFDNMQPGTVYVDPQDGKLYMKK